MENYIMLTLYRRAILYDKHSLTTKRTVRVPTSITPTSGPIFLIEFGIVSEKERKFS